MMPLLVPKLEVKLVMVILCPLEPATKAIDVGRLTPKLDPDVPVTPTVEN